MFRYFTKKNTRRYIDILQDIASKYNASYHRSIKMAPKITKLKSRLTCCKEDSLINEEKKNLA